MSDIGSCCTVFLEDTADDAGVNRMIFFSLLKQCDFLQNKLHGTNPSASKVADFRTILAKGRMIALM